MLAWTISVLAVGVIVAATTTTPVAAARLNTRGSSAAWSHAGSTTDHAARLALPDDTTSTPSGSHNIGQNTTTSGAIAREAPNDDLPPPGTPPMGTGSTSTQQTEPSVPITIPLPPPTAPPTTLPPRPPRPPFALWHPPVDRVPLVGNYFYVEADPPKNIEFEPWRTYTPANSVMTLNDQGGIELTILHEPNQSGFYIAMRSQGDGRTLPPVGEFVGLPRYGGWPPSEGMTLSYNGSVNCNTSASELVIDEAVYVGGHPSLLRLRFESVCAIGGETVRGELVWNALLA